MLVARLRVIQSTWHTREWPEERRMLKLDETFPFFVPECNPHYQASKRV
jgi:hypothetical protein